MAQTHLDTTSETAPLLPKDHVKTSSSTTVLEQSETQLENHTLAETEAAVEQDNRQYEGLPEVRKNLKWAYPALLLGVFLCSSDQTLVATSWSKIGSDLHALNNTSWIATAYSATVIACHPLYGRLSDIFGRKSCILTAYVLFAIGTVLCGFARTITELAIARAIAGAGGGGMNSLVCMIIADAVPLRNRPAWLVYTSIAWFLGASAGGPIGGLLADTVGWRWSFWGQVPLVMLAFLLVSMALKMPNKDDDEDGASRLARIDFPGSCLLVSTIAAFLLTLDQGSNQGWTAPTPLTYAAFLVSLLVAFVYVELRVAKHPIMPFDVVLTRGTVPVHVAGFLSMACFFTINMFAPLYLIAVKRYTTTEASVAMIPRSIGTLVGYLTAAQWIKRRGTYWNLTIWNWLGAATCYIGMLSSAQTLFDSDKAFVIFFGLSSMFGGAAAATSNIALVANSTYEDQGVNLGAMYFFRALGSVWGVSASATIVNTVLRYLLTARLDEAISPGMPGADTIADHVRKNLGYVDQLPAKLAQIVTACYARAVAGSFAFNCGMFVLAGVASWFVIEKPLDKKS